MSDTVGIAVGKPVSPAEVMQQLQDAGITSLDDLASSMSDASQDLVQDDVAASFVFKAWRLD